MKQSRRSRPGGASGTNVEKFPRRSLSLLPAPGSTSPRVKLDYAAALRRARRLVDVVQNGCHGQGQESWTLDKEIAENALAYFEAKARNPKARPGRKKWDAVLFLSAGTGISLDWLFIGDPGDLIDRLVYKTFMSRQRAHWGVLHPQRKTARRPRKIVDLEKERDRRRHPGPQGPPDQPAA